MTTPMVTASAGESYVAAFEDVARSTSVPPAVQSIRRAAFDRFASLGFPTTKNEDWHFTSVSPIAEQEFTPLVAASGDVSRGDLTPFAFGGGSSGWYTLVFVNGRFAAELSDVAKLPAGVEIRDLATAWTAAPNLVDRVDRKSVV